MNPNNHLRSGLPRNGEDFLLKAVPERIGRFNIVKELGKGSQGVVYLGEDPWLERQVAIKTLDIRINAQRERHARLMQEARIVSRLQHPNVISVYDIGEYEGKPYLVLEYVEGVSLKSIIRGANGPLDIKRAVSIMTQVLAGIAYAHQQNVVHRDLNPSNIMVSAGDAAKIMDFGISMTVGEKKELAGTPCYMSPEHFSSAALGPASDIFSLGLVLYEMLTGGSAFKADNHIAVMYKIANEQVEPPSRKNRKIGWDLDRIVLKSVNRALESRYGDALVMKHDLENYLLRLDGEEAEAEEAQGESGREGAAGSAEVHSTVEFLLRRMSRKKDFPAFSHHILEINEKASPSAANQASALQLANVILKDLSLTNKLLRLVNSAFYGQFSGKITSISRAVVLLGFVQVRMAAASLLLFEHLQNKTQMLELKDAAIGSFMSGLIAKDLARDAGMKGAEEVFICSMLHNLGKHLVMFCLTDEYKEIKATMGQDGMTEKKASRAVLGISYEELGVEVLKAWNFPAKIINTLRRLPPGEVAPPKSETETLQCISNLSNELCDVVRLFEAQDAGEALFALADRYKNSVPVSARKLRSLLKSARRKIEKYSEVLGINSDKSEFLGRLQVLMNLQLDAAGPLRLTVLPGGDAFGDRRGQEKGEDGFEQDAAEENSEIVRKENGSPLSVLINGIQEIAAVLVGRYELNDIMFMVLETMYRGLGFNRVVFCLRDTRKPRVNARFGFGDDAQEIVGKFTFQLITKAYDFFNLAVSTGRDYFVEDVNAPHLSLHIPDWYRRDIGAPAFLLYPLVVKKVGIGLFYADRDHAGPIITEGQKLSLNTLRSQAIYAINQKR